MGRFYKELLLLITEDLSFFLHDTDMFAPWPWHAFINFNSAVLGYTANNFIPHIHKHDIEYGVAILFGYRPGYFTEFPVAVRGAYILQFKVRCIIIFPFRVLILHGKQRQSEKISLTEKPF